MVVSSFNTMSCPSDKDLLAFFRSNLPKSDMDQIHDHVENCGQCILFVDKIGDDSDTIVKALSVVDPTDDDEPEYCQLRANLIRSPESIDSTISFEELTDDRADRPDPYQRIGSRIENYDLLSLLGYGANGAVYRARHLQLDREFAIKLLLPTGGNADRSVQRFKNEMKAVGRLDHPNIVKATHAGESQDGEHFFVMEFVDGIDASTLVRRVEQLSVCDAVEIVCQAARGLAFAHQSGMVHRDVKPSNLLFGFDGSVRLLDLGLVSLGDESEKPFTALARGTADYMAPEQWHNYDAVDERADIYSLGCTLFKLLAGHAPFVPLPAGFSSKMQAHQFAQVPSIRNRRGDVPLGIDRIIRRMLNKKVDERYANMDEVIAAMSPYAEGADLHRLADQICGRPVSQPVPKIEESGWFTRRHALMGIAAGLGLVLIGRNLIPTDNRQKLQFDTWRGMQSTKPGRVLSSGITKLDFDPAQSVYTISTEDLRSDYLAIYPTGQPVHSPFAMEVEVTLLTKESAAGLFFGYRPEKLEIGTHHPLETIYLKRIGEKITLHWAKLRWDYSPLESRVQEDPLGQIRLPLHSGESIELHVEIGASAIPTVIIAGQQVDSKRWILTHDGTITSRTSNSELGARFDGQVGLFVARSNASFRQPRLKYIE